MGELGPIPKFRLVILDMIIFALQLLHMTANHHKQKESGATRAQEQPQPQDLESEEAGQLRSRANDQPAETQDGIEMQNLLPERNSVDQLPDEGTNKPVQADDLIVLDIREALTTLLRRPMGGLRSNTTDEPTRAWFASALARTAAARATVT